MLAKYKMYSILHLWLLFKTTNNTKTAIRLVNTKKKMEIPSIPNIKLN